MSKGVWLTADDAETLSSYPRFQTWANRRSASGRDDGDSHRGAHQQHTMVE